MRIATWNVNSLNVRLPRVEEWLEYAQPDVLCMQETKLADAAFPYMAFEALGYEVVHHGEGRWNGVAIASRVGVVDPARPVFAHGDAAEARVVQATCGGVRVTSVYAPNGRDIGHEHYRYKLAWYDMLTAHVAETVTPDDLFLIAGDFNIAPSANDVAAPISAETHTSDAVRGKLAALEDWGLIDSFRNVYPEEPIYSWWDYRAGDFHQGRGLRIDLMMVTRPLAERMTWALIDRNARKGKQPSDHAPVFIDVDVDTEVAA